MEQFCTEFREVWFTDTGGVRTHKVDKILYKADLPAEQINEGYDLPVWIEATIKESEDDQVWLDDVEVLNGFKNKRWNELVVEHANDIANKFRGHKPIRLTRNENWFVVPQGKKTGVTEYINKNGHEALAAALGFPQQILPITKLLELMKLPPNLPPSHLPFFILHERETIRKNS